MSKELEILRAYVEEHEDKVLEMIKAASVESVKYINVKQHIAAYVESDSVELTLLDEYADDVRMTRLDGKNPYIIYTSITDLATAETICDRGDGTTAESDDEILDELDNMVDWRDELSNVYRKLSDRED